MMTKQIWPIGLLAYRTQRNNARSRKIDWNLSYEEWITWWLSTGHFNQRGRYTGEYCMCRFNDTGPYELGNIYCATLVENTKAALCGKKKSEEHRAKLAEGLEINRPKNKKKVYTKDKTFESISEAARYYGMSSEGVARRVRKPRDDYSEWKFI